MRRRFTLLFTAIMLFLPSGTQAGVSDCEELDKLIADTYGFKPSKISPEQRTAKSNDLDKVWRHVEGNLKIQLPCLRSAVANRKDDTFFRFDAVNLIAKHDRSEDTKRLMIEVYAATDLADVNLPYWLGPIAALGVEGYDVSAPGMAWMRYDRAEYSLPSHGGRVVDKSIGALAIFGSMEEKLATPVLAVIAANENSNIRSTIIWLLVNQATTESDSEVRSLSTKLPEPLAKRLLRDISDPKLIEARTGAPKTSRATFIKALNELLAGKPDTWAAQLVAVPDGEKDMVAVFTEADIPLVRKVRRFYASNASPHSPDWYVTFTKIINTLRAKSAPKAKQ